MADLEHQDGEGDAGGDRELAHHDATVVGEPVGRLVAQVATNWPAKRLQPW